MDNNSRIMKELKELQEASRTVSPRLMRSIGLSGFVSYLSLLSLRQCTQLFQYQSDDLLLNQTDSKEKSYNQILKSKDISNWHMTRVTVVWSRYDLYRKTIFTDLW